MFVVPWYERPSSPCSPCLITSTRPFLLPPFQEGRRDCLWLGIVCPSNSSNYCQTCLLNGILVWFWTIPDTWRQGSSRQKLNPNPRQVKWLGTRSHRISPYFQTAKCPSSSVCHCPGAHIQTSYVLVFQSNLVVIGYVFQYFLKLHPNKCVRKK